MPEAEDVIVDAARHAAGLIQRLWQRTRGRACPPDATPAFRRLELVLSGVFSGRFELRLAQAPLPRTLANRWFHRNQGLCSRQPLPATDGHTLWLPLLRFE